MCAKLVLGFQKYDSSRQALYELHWLPIKSRITFKILTYMYNCSMGCAPAYLKELLSEQVSTRALRSSSGNQGLYSVPFNKRKIFSDRSFGTAGPMLWNQLPRSIRSSSTVELFKRNLKAFYFGRFYDLF